MVWVPNRDYCFVYNFERSSEILIKLLLFQFSKEVMVVHSIIAMGSILFGHGGYGKYTGMTDNRAPRCSGSTERDLCYQNKVERGDKVLNMISCPYMSKMIHITITTELYFEFSNLRHECVITPTMSRGLLLFLHKH